jgi:Domain of unknown function (DUF1841)
VPFTVGKAELDRYAAGLEREVALDLRGALAWFGADEDGPDVCVSRHDLQQFVHYTLPRKFLVGVEEQVAIARALGDALERLGAPQAYADLCRSPETLALLRLWDVDEDAAFAQFAALADASGLEPPDVDELEWRGVTGMVEAQTRDAATLELERALESDDRRPAAEIVRAVLSEPDPEGVYSTRLEAVQAERIDHWAGWRDSPRRALLEPLLGGLVGAREPQWPADDVLDWLLAEAQTGLALTERGALGRAIVVEVGRRRPGWTWGKLPRSEAEVDHLERLHGALRGSGLVRRRGRKLLATELAGQLSPGARRVRLLACLLDGDTFQAAVAELTLAALAQDVADPEARVTDAIAAEGWRSDGGALPDLAVPSTMTDVRYVLLAIGAAEGDALTLRGGCSLTERGRAAVLCALRAHALRPPPPPAAPLPELEPLPDLIAERVGAALPPVPGGAPAHLDPADEDDRAELIRLAHPRLAAALAAGEEVVIIRGEAVNPRLHLLMHQAVADRLLHDDPPEDWLELEALLERGVDAHEAQHAVGRRFVEELIAEFGPPAPRPEPHRRSRGERRSRERRKAQRAARRRNRR